MIFTGIIGIGGVFLGTTPEFLDVADVSDFETFPVVVSHKMFRIAGSPPEGTSGEFLDVALLCDLKTFPVLYLNEITGIGGLFLRTTPKFLDSADVCDL